MDNLIIMSDEVYFLISLQYLNTVFKYSDIQLLSLFSR